MNEFINGLEGEEEFEDFLYDGFASFREYMGLEELEIWPLTPEFVFRSHKPHWILITYANEKIVNYVPPFNIDMFFTNFNQSLPVVSLTGEEMEPLDISVAYIPDIRDMTEDIPPSDFMYSDN